MPLGKQVFSHRLHIGAATAALALAACAPHAAPGRAGSIAISFGSDPRASGTLVALAVGGPAAPATAVTVTATCPSGAVPVGGGVSTALVGGGKPPSSLHANGSVPSAGGWQAMGASGGQPVLGGQTTSFAICAAGGPGSVQIVQARADGPGAARTIAQATASCPAGTVLLGGGGSTGASAGGPGSPSLHLIGTFPSDPAGTPVAGGDAPFSWTARAGAGGRQGSGLETSAYAVCAAWPGHRTVAASASRPGPLDPGGSQPVVVGCPAGSSLIGGGAMTGIAGGGVPQQGLHLTGSYPSDPAGRPMTSPAPGSPSWGARAEAGGQGSPPGTATTAFAVCLRS